MKTITPFELQMLIYERHVEVIDVRPRRDFEKAHVLVARSIPLKSFEPHSVLAHRRFKKEPLYIMGQGKAQCLPRCRQPAPRLVWRSQLLWKED